MPNKYEDLLNNYSEIYEEEQKPEELGYPKGTENNIIEELAELRRPEIEIEKLNNEEENDELDERLISAREAQREADVLKEEDNVAKKLAELESRNNDNTYKSPQELSNLLKEYKNKKGTEGVNEIVTNPYTEENPEAPELNFTPPEESDEPRLSTQELIEQNVEELNPYERLISQYERGQSESEKELAEAKRKAAMSQFIANLGRTGSKVVEGFTGVRGAPEIYTGIERAGREQVAEKRAQKAQQYQDLMKKLQLRRMAEPAPTKLPQTQVIEVGDRTKLINKQTGETIKDLGQAKKKKGQEFSDDPMSQESRQFQQRLKDIGFTGNVENLPANLIAGNWSSFVRKITRPIDIQRESRLKEKQAWQVSEKDEVSDKQLESINSIKGLQNVMTRAEDLRKKGIKTGWASQKQHELGKFTGVQDPDRAALTQLVGTNLADYVKSISGAAVSEQEAQRLLRNIPNMEDPANVFDRKLKEFNKTLNNSLKIRYKNMKEFQGKMVPKKEVKEEIRDSKIEEYAKKYNLDYNKASAILKARGYKGK
jgi:hypothetical protein